MTLLEGVAAVLLVLASALVLWAVRIFDRAEGRASAAPARRREAEAPATLKAA